MTCWVITITDTIQSREYSKDGGMDGTPYITATLTTTSMSVTCIGTMVSGTGATTG